ncbi:uncharacterized protein LOC124156137 [Ischnura elegans]|uniref:uncharacterized protein LOC124156137 n=1 Tax=Ischnura elegans TaxID=197161 RepID=UPI001ED8935B|nr:uncharacterized protein LOC124156137 [Ischnura elegans]
MVRRNHSSSVTPTRWPTPAPGQWTTALAKGGPPPGPSWWSRRARPPRNLDLVTFPSDNVPACFNFSVGNPEGGEFFSPNYPNNYPNHTDCTRVLQAKQNHLLRLDFRDAFHLEPSDDCRFDYLEVRDGAYGFSSQLGRFCGHNFPPMITSSGPFLHLKFHSDESAEYSGFHAVYTVIPKPENLDNVPVENCFFNVGGDEGFINKSDISAERIRTTVEHNIPLDCMWVIKVRDGWRIMLAFQKFKLENPNDCESNYVDIFAEMTELPHRLKNFCGSIADSVVSKTNILHVHFYTEAKAVNSTFEALFTAYKDKPTGQTCGPDEYDCEDATCISSSLRCNGRINCRFRWDEDECAAKKGSMLMQSEHIIIIMVMFCLILFGMCFAFVFNCVRKLVRDHRIMQDHIRQSREGQLDTLGRLGAGSGIIAAPAGGSSGAVSASSSSPPQTRRRRSHRPHRRLSSRYASSASTSEDDDEEDEEAARMASAGREAVYGVPTAPADVQNKKTKKGRKGAKEGSNGEALDDGAEPAGCYVPAVGAGGGRDLLPTTILTHSLVSSAKRSNGDAVFVRREAPEDDAVIVQTRDAEVSVQVGEGDDTAEGENGEEDEEEEEEEEEDEDEMGSSPGPPPVQMRDNECQTRDSLLLMNPPVMPCPAHKPPLTMPRPQPPPIAPRPVLPPFTTFGRGAGHGNRVRPPQQNPNMAPAPPMVHQTPPPPPHIMAAQHTQLPPGKRGPPPDHRGGVRPDATPDIGRQGQGPGQRPFSIESTKSAPDVIVMH